MKKGFTLIELLSVIVILAIILAIAVPVVSNMVSNSTKAALNSDAKLVIKSIDYKLLEDDSFDPTTVNEGNVGSLLGLSNENYESLDVAIIDNKIHVAIVGKNKWSGYSACGSFQSIQVSSEACSLDFVSPVITLNGNATVNINLGDTYVDAGATASDNHDGDITASIVTNSTVNTSISGTYTVTYNVSDSSANAATPVTRTVNVLDTLTPTVAFGTNGSGTWAKTISTTVTVSDNVAVNTSSLKYQWTTSTTDPSEASFSTSFTNGDTISSQSGVTGSYYLWILAKDNSNNTIITKSNAFSLDNTAPVITVTGSNPISVGQGGIYNDAGATATDANSGLSGSVTATGTVNINVVGSYTITYNVSDNAGNAATPATRTVNVVPPLNGPGYIASKGVNGPVLATGMTPIKWNGSTWVDTDVYDTNWYNYDTINKIWANAKTADGSMWVWVPRYAYQIASNYHTSTAGTINIKFLKGTTNTASDDSTVVAVPTYSGSAQTNYIRHSAFIFGTTEVTGVWIAKFEMSGTTTTLESKPNVSSNRSLSIGDSFNYSRSMETNSRYGWGTTGTGIDTHLIKNTEWAAAAYLSKSTYGINGEVGINNNSNNLTGCGAAAGSSSSSTCNAYNTATGMLASTTGNIYGIYDMSGGAYEWSMGNLNNLAGNSGLTPSSINDKYIDRYTAYSSAKYGDAIYETSSSSTGTNGWYGDYSNMITTTGPWSYRGGGYGNTTASGVFRFDSISGESGFGLGFRTTFIVETGL